MNREEKWKCLISLLFFSIYKGSTNVILKVMDIQGEATTLSAEKGKSEFLVGDNKNNLTWRDLLRSLTSDPQEQQRIIDVLGINAMTLRRWINNETNPRPQNLRLLLNALPHHRRLLVSLLSIEFPAFKRETTELDENEIALIPAEFYARFISLYTTVAQHMRRSVSIDLILQQMVKQLDPDLDGLLIMIAQCVTPKPGQKVRSLRLTEGRGTSIWTTYVEHHPRFFGAEALIGYATSSMHLTMLPSRDEYVCTFPDDQIEGVNSVVAAPIVMADQTAGGIYVGSRQTNFFSPLYVSLLQKYVELLCLALEKDEFFPLSEIALGVQPAAAVQLSLLASFQSRVNLQMVRASSENRMMMRAQAEKIVCQQLEDELLHIVPGS